MPWTKAARTEVSSDGECRARATAMPAKTLWRTPCAAAGGSPESASRLTYAEARALPTMALPRGAPVFLSAWRTPEPTPARSLDSSARAAEAAVAIVSPVPAPTIAIQVATKASPEDSEVVAPMARPSPSTRKPAATVSLAPIALAIRAAGSRPTSIPPTTGSRRTPDPSGLVPTTPWKYWGMVKRRPINASVSTAKRMTPQVKERERKRLRSTSGWPPGRCSRSVLPEEERHDQTQSDGERERALRPRPIRAVPLR